MELRRGGLDDPHVVALIKAHVSRSLVGGSPHSLGPDALDNPDIEFWTLWEGEALVAMGALRRLPGNEGELKSMHVAEARRGEGHGRAMLDHLIDRARAGGLARVCLETGSWDYFRPSRALYARAGFLPCPPFADYRPVPNSVFLVLELR